ncbi:nose resistant to fluoxetine protein 6-like [Dysidea avara]|uniref:nose resistant to fluoxetine protein 6-like n=1 Tax=Dysidea avara TaxID=196820 RepID=UPI00331DFB9A
MFKLLVFVVLLWSFPATLCNDLEETSRARVRAAGAELVGQYFYPRLIQSVKSFKLSDTVTLGQYQNLANSDSVIKCGEHFSKFIASLNTSHQLQYYMDSFGKPEAGILYGNYIFLGNYDECILIGDTDFCLFPYNVTVYDPLNHKNISEVFDLGMCYPELCSAQDFYALVNYYVFTELHNLNFSAIGINATIESVLTGPSCPWRNLKWTASSIIMLFVCCLMASLVLLGTLVDILIWAFDILHKHRQCNEMKAPITLAESVSGDEKESINDEEPLINSQPKRQEYGYKRSDLQHRLMEFGKDLILSFSLYKTIPTIMATFQPPNAITSINGIRVISMFWVILGHTFLWGLFYRVTDDAVYAIENVPKKFAFQPVANSYLSVDSFFVMSGLLLSYLGIKEMERRKGKFPYLFFYVHRVLRLSPAYYFVLFAYYKILPHVGSGPLWIIEDIARCDKYWWTNILYINNFYPTKFSDQCYGVTWYLANDMQFFIISPIFLVLLYHFWYVGLAAIGGTMMLSFITIGTLAGIKNPNANLLQGSLPINGTSADISDFAYSNIYEKPYCRINAYLIGVLLGFVLYKKWKVPGNFWVRLGIHGALWVAAAIFCSLIAYGQYQTWNDHPFNKAENVLFFMFNRTVWSTGIAVVIYLCHNNFGGAINTFLSWGVWVPLSRLTFMAYLSHPIILTVIYSTMRSQFLYTHYYLSMLVVAAVVLSYSLALAFASFVEYPLANVESAVYKFAGIKRRK